MRRDALARALSSLCAVVTVLGSGRVHTWCDVVVTRGSGSDVDRRRDRRVESCARGPVNGRTAPVTVWGLVHVRGMRNAGRRSMSMTHVCRAGAGRRGPWGGRGAAGGVSAQSLQSTPGGEARLGPFQSGPTPLVINVTNARRARIRPQPQGRRNPGPRRIQARGVRVTRHMPCPTCPIPPTVGRQVAPRARASFPVTAYTPTAVRVSRFNGNRRAVRLRYKNKFTFFYRSPITPTPLTRFRF